MPLMLMIGAADDVQPHPVGRPAAALGRVPHRRLDRCSAAPQLPQLPQPSLPLQQLQLPATSSLPARAHEPSQQHTQSESFSSFARPHLPLLEAMGFKLPAGAGQPTVFVADSAEKRKDA